VWAALTFTKRLPKPIDQSCVFQVVRVSGTIKKAEEEAIRRARSSIKSATQASVRPTSLIMNDPDVSMTDPVDDLESSDEAGNGG
jgi:ribonuclease P/MRP protein subunit POP5